MTGPILSGDHITQRFGGLLAVDDVNFRLGQNEIIGIIGPNGAGKSTLFNCITGIYPPSSGQILFEGRDITGRRPYEVTALGIARTFQNIRLFHNMTAIENIMVGAHTRLNSGILDAVLKLPRHCQSEKMVLELAEEKLETVGLSAMKYEYATSLPYGSQRRLEIARALASEPRILLLDEPAAGMNENETNDLIALIRQLQKQGITILLIEHDMRLVMSICERIYVLDHGTLICEGFPEEVRRNQRVIEAYLGKEV